MATDTTTRSFEDDGDTSLAELRNFVDSLEDLDDGVAVDISVNTITVVWSN